MTRAIEHTARPDHRWITRAGGEKLQKSKQWWSWLRARKHLFPNKLANTTDSFKFIGVSDGPKGLSHSIWWVLKQLSLELPSTLWQLKKNNLRGWRWSPRNSEIGTMGAVWSGTNTEILISCNLQNKDHLILWINWGITFEIQGGNLTPCQRNTRFYQWVLSNQPAIPSLT